MIYNVLRSAKRPLLVYGWGIHLSKAEDEALLLAHRTGIPVVCTWGAADLFHFNDPVYVGTFGTHGVRYANFAVQNADVIVSVGSRLDTKATGSPISSFAPKAKIFMVDIDQTEINKFGSKVEGICMDAQKFLVELLMKDLSHPLYRPEGSWLDTINKWKQKYPVVLPEYGKDNPYVFVKKLSSLLKPDDVIVSDTGCALGWMMQAFEFTGQRFIHAFNNTPMGYGLPAAIGASFACGDSGVHRIILISGDGGLSVNITELATVYRHNLPIKIILFNNRGHAMCRQTQRQWLGGEYPATSYESGLACPDFIKITHAYGIPGYLEVENLLWAKGPGFLQLDIDPEQGIVPQVKFGHRLEDGEPLLPKEEIAEIMAA